MRKINVNNTGFSDRRDMPIPHSPYIHFKIIRENIIPPGRID
jgi:hypothetical protein